VVDGVVVEVTVVELVDVVVVGFVAGVVVELEVVEIVVEVGLVTDSVEDVEDFKVEDSDVCPLMVLDDDRDVPVLVSVAGEVVIEVAVVTCAAGTTFPRSAKARTPTVATSNAITYART
jgi:hypothetical protein